MDSKNIIISNIDSIYGNDYVLTSSIIPDNFHMYTFLENKRGNIQIQTPFILTDIYNINEIHLNFTHQNHIDLLLKIIEIDNDIEHFLKYTHKLFIPTIKNKDNIYKLIFNTSNIFNAWDSQGNKLNIESWLFKKSLIKWNLKPLAVWSNKKYHGIQWMLSGAIINMKSIDSIDESVELLDFNYMQNEIIDIISDYLNKKI